MRPTQNVLAVKGLAVRLSPDYGSTHDWWDWYAAYMRTRQVGSTPDEAAAAAGRYMAEVKHVVVPSS